MNVLLISAKVENPSGGIAAWTEHYLTGCKEIENHEWKARHLCDRKAKLERRVFSYIRNYRTTQ